MEFVNLDLMILGEGQGAYQARIVESPGGSANLAFKVPFDRLELEEYLMRLRKPSRSSAEVQAAKDFGGKLYDTLFQGDMRDVLRSSKDEADRAGKGLRLRLRFGDSAADLGDIPWELLYYKSLNRFLALSNDTPIVRYLELPERIEPLTAKPPLNILVMISSPSDQVQLDVEQEWSNVKKALAKHESKGTVTLTRLDNATLSSLQQQLRKKNYHIFHFIGHGEFDKKEGDGTLLFENDDETTHAIAGSALGTLLSDQKSMRVVVLNACEGGRASRESQFAGAAQSLVQAGIPAVVAQQFKVADDAAIALAREFHGALADGFPVDAAVTEGRKAVAGLNDNVEWATPVLYMRAPDGQIFDLGKKEAGMAGDSDKKEDKNSGISISVGGDASGKIIAAGGDVHSTEIGSVGGDYVAGDQNIGGDKVSGDKISVGNISGSNVALGRGSSVTVDNSQTTINNPFDATRQKLTDMDLSDDDKEEVESALKRIEKEAEKEQAGEEPDDDKIDRYLAVIEDVAPDAVEVLINAITNPGAAVGSGVRVAVKAFRKARKAGQQD